MSRQCTNATPVIQDLLESILNHTDSSKTFTLNIYKTIINILVISIEPVYLFIHLIPKLFLSFKAQHKLYELH